MRRLGTAAVVVATLLTGCGGPDEQSQQPAPAENASPSSASVTPDSSTDATAGPTEESPEALDVATVIGAEVPRISEVVRITEDNDPNDLIGRPNGYVDGAVLFDERSDALDDEPGVAQGAFLEVWPDETSAQQRSDYIQSVLDETGFLGTEYNYVEDGYLLRVSGTIKPSDAAVYESAFRRQF